MKKILIAVSIIMMCSFGVANAEYKFAENWSKADTAWQSAFAATLMLDWMQTRYISKHPEEYREINPILGSHPSSDKVDLYFISCIVAHTLIAMALKPEVANYDHKINPRRLWQGIWIGIETGTVMRNMSIGIKFEY